MKNFINISFYSIIIFTFCLINPKFTWEANNEDSDIIKLKSTLDSFHKKMEKYIESTDLIEKDKFSILFAGDILLANNAEENINKFGKEYPFSSIKKELNKYDIVFANLETPISVRGKPVKHKPYTFQIPPGIGSTLNKIKLDIVSIANNHIMDFGIHGYKDTVNFLKQNNILYSGAGNDVSSARSPTYMNIGKTEILFFSRCSRPPNTFYTKGNKPGTAQLEVDDLIQDIKEFKTEDNIILVSLHWGIEHTHIPTSDQVEIAHKIIDSGADAIIGHHPHWPQSIEIYENKPILYSLGNFINGFYNRIEKDNILVILYFDTNTLQKMEVLSIAGKNKETAFQPYVIKGPRAKNNLLLIKEISKGFNLPMQIHENKGVIFFKKI